MANFSTNPCHLQAAYLGRSHDVSCCRKQPFVSTTCHANVLASCQSCSLSSSNLQQCLHRQTGFVALAGCTVGRAGCRTQAPCSLQQMSLHTILTSLLTASRIIIHRNYQITAYLHTLFTVSDRDNSRAIMQTVCCQRNAVQKYAMLH